jgi:hypothetical protein
MCGGKRVCCSAAMGVRECLVWQWLYTFHPLVHGGHFGASISEGMSHLHSQLCNNLMERHHATNMYQEQSAGVRVMSVLSTGRHLVHQELSFDVLSH